MCQREASAVQGKQEVLLAGQGEYKLLLGPALFTHNAKQLVLLRTKQMERGQNR